jgi:endogenous inhibitor of DNA gyrase (YacG/DUF329 family)
MTASKCPICSKPTEAGYKPFCSRRCADVDLQRWLTERYVVPSTEDDEAPSDDGADV